MESFVFLLEDLDQINIAVNDVENGSEFGQINLSAEELAQNPLRRKILPINPDQPFMTATISANIKFC